MLNGVAGPRACATAVDLTHGRDLVLFGNYSRTARTSAPRLINRATAVDAALSAVAAPSYFPVHDAAGGGIFAHGALARNNPADVGLAGMAAVQSRVCLVYVGTEAAGATDDGYAGPPFTCFLLFSSPALHTFVFQRRTHCGRSTRLTSSSRLLPRRTRRAGGP